LFKIRANASWKIYKLLNMIYYDYILKRFLNIKAFSELTRIPLIIFGVISHKSLFYYKLMKIFITSKEYLPIYRNRGFLCLITRMIRNYFWFHIFPPVNEKIFSSPIAIQYIINIIRSDSKKLNDYRAMILYYYLLKLFMAI
jgi:hypothetical protein